MRKKFSAARGCCRVALAFVFTFSLFASDASAQGRSYSNSDFKHLSGAADEFAAMRLPHAAETGTRSQSAMLPIRSGEQFFDLPVEGGKNLRLMLLAPRGAEMQIELAADGESDFQNLRIANGFAARTETTYGIDGQQYPAEVFVIENAPSKSLRLRIDAPTASADKPLGYLIYSSADSKYRLYAHQTTNQTLTGREIGWAAKIFDREGEPTESGNPHHTLRGAVMSDVALSVDLPNGNSLTLPMFDDGQHADGASGDGTYGATMRAELSGNYTAHVKMRGIAADGTEFLRTAEILTPVVRSNVRFDENGEVRAQQIDGLRYRINLPLSGDVRRGDKFIAYGEIWQRGATDKPVAWLGGMAFAQNKASARKAEATGVYLPLEFDARWLAAADIDAQENAQFEIRNLRLQEPNSYILLDETANIAVEGLRPTQQALESFGGAITDEMRLGVRPERYAQNNAAGGKLMLVHGYCSGDAWGAAASAGQFTDFIKFADFNQNRSHDQFAQIIRNFGANLPSFGIVAHSQGGAASLHLYAFYWSGLDAAGSGRLIQSVGTPYQGTALAGNLAALGSIFGVGCGANTDLTYNGAANWLAGVPSFARAKVFYHTTSYRDLWWRYDYCNLASDVILGDPEDGVVEKAFAQLSGANNLGHKEGWCHTSGMRDPSQTTDSARNTNMSANAAR